MCCSWLKKGWQRYVKRLWDRIVRWFRFWRLKGGKITQANASNTAERIYDAMCDSEEDANMSKDEFVKEFTEMINPRSIRGELHDIILDNQLDRARAFGQEHRAKRGKQ